MTGSGIGAGFRGPLFDKKLTIGLKGLYGEGVGRYGSSTIADVTVRPDGLFAPLRAFSALSTLEMNPTKRLMLYFNYGGDYVDREYWLSAKGGKAIGYGIPGYISGSPSMSGCDIEVVPSSTTGASNPSSCGAQNKDVQEVTVGYWYNIYSGPRADCATACSIAGSSAIFGRATAAPPTPAAAGTATTTRSTPRSVTTCRKESESPSQRRAAPNGLPFFLAALFVRGRSTVYETRNNIAAPLPSLSFPSPDERLIVPGGLLRP